jgi:ribonuclease BN (tRNA processing enzyme)
MRITLLGTGTPSPSVTRQSSGYLVDVGGELLVFDHGPGAHHRLIEAGHRAVDVRYAFFSHLHYDHCMDYGRLVLQRWDQGAGRIPDLEVYGPTPIARMSDLLFGEDGVYGPDIRARIRHQSSIDVFEARGGTPPRKPPAPRVREVHAGDAVETPNWKVTVGHASHVQPELECLAFRLESNEGSVCYSGDSGACDELVRLARGCDVLIHMNHHFSGTEPSESYRKACGNHRDNAGVAKRAGVKTLVLTHLLAQANRAVALTRSLANEARAAGGLVARPGISPAVALRAAGHLDALRGILGDWNAFYDGYDPLYSWWARESYGRLQKGLAAYADAIRLHMVGMRPGETPPIVGDPVLADGLAADLAYEMIPYTPDELIAIGMKEFTWIEGQFRVVAREMGFGDDWKAALEHTKNLAPPPGEKPWVIFDIAKYSEDFVERMRALTLPPLAHEVWRLAMQTPERQLVNPFFTGGEVTRVSYPSDAMTQEDKLMSMRGNTPHFNFATVHHELIPGHHLQAFVTERFNSHRAALHRTPFWREGWSLYWELQLWDRNFPRNNPDKIGMLFWRLHRAARIVFSLNFHLGRWTPGQAVDFLVDRVGHERANAEAEVRRTTVDAPLYQVAYMLGGLQFRALYRELVDSGRMTAAQFHDAVLLGGAMPVELVRARLTGQGLTRDTKTAWRFYGDPLPR